MSVPPFVPLGPPPLPVGWTEHIGPGGQVYYHNVQTQESTYIRPLPTFPTLPPPLTQTAKKKKEKPLVKTPIPGTDWLRVKTTEGNIFYSHKVKKESIWVVPEEIKDAVDILEREEREKEAKEQKELQDKQEERVKEAENERMLEIERVKTEVQDIVKRKAEDVVPVDEIVIFKKARTNEDEEDEESGVESEEEEWQREAAAQLAAEAEEEKKRVAEEAHRAREEAEAEAMKAKETVHINMPERVDLSVEEAKALFKTLLREKDINPLHPWDTSLPLFVSDPRYVLLPSVSARREAFDEYCRDRAREMRQSNVKKEREAANPKEEFERLLREEVKSTRLTWGEFRRTWKKDRRFWGWGRDDREREKRFRDYIKDLGEKKRAAAQKAETDFFVMLKESGSVEKHKSWKDVKGELSDDPRYHAVGSSSLREELFNTFQKASGPSPTTFKTTTLDQQDGSTDKEDPVVKNEADLERRRNERKERAVREREEKVKAERGRLEADIGRSRLGLNKEEGEREFKSMLTDAIRDPQISWDDALPQLKTDPRFINSPLPLNQRLHFFHSHVGQLQSKHLSNVHTLFESHAPSLATSFTSLPLPSLLSSLPVVKLGLDVKSLELEFEKWQRERTHESRKAFDEMLSDNSFVEFWGRLGKIGGEGVDGGVKADEMEEDEGEGGGGKVDMKVLAKNIDVREMEKVLRNDKRYIMFDHVPEQRERWVRDYISQLSAPKLSVHLQQ